MSAAAIQTAVFTRLTGDAALAALLAVSVDDASLAAVYDYVPQPVDPGSDVPFPYLTIGDDTLGEWDTDTSDGLEVTLTLHAWARSRGRLVVKKIQDACHAALHRHALAVTGWDTVLLYWSDSRTLVESDGLTHHGVQTFRLLVDKDLS